MSFRIGQKVVCVDNVTPSTGASSRHWHSRCDVPVIGNVYTVRQVGTFNRDGNVLGGLKFQEITGCARFDGQFHEDCFYWSARFRPVVERKTDISTFTEMLKTDRAPALSKAD